MIDKEVYKNPQLDLVGWWTIGVATGPEQRHLPAQTQIQTEYNLESAPLLLFHPDMVGESSGTAGKLPLTIYETVWTSDNSSMEVDGGDRNQSLKYREIRYTVETGEAEMISVDFVARGGGNATAVDTSFAKVHSAGESSKKMDKAKSKEDAQTNGFTGEASYLTPEEDELLTSLTAKANAVKMLQSRLNLLTAYLQSLPPTYLSDPAISLNPESTLNLNQPILRSISALLARLPLLTPPDTASFTRESEQTASDVELITLLSSLTRTVQDAKELGRKWNLAEPRKGRGGAAFSQSALAGLSDFTGDDEGASGVGRLQELMNFGS
jgi:COP9 signalosome complex subunit 6